MRISDWSSDVCSSDLTNESHTYYKVVFNEAVSGLSKGSLVQYSGIKVGDVVELALDVNDPSKVWARIRIEGRVPIKQDTQAILAVTGITGVSVLQFSVGTPESPLLVGKNGERSEERRVGKEGLR